MVFKPTIQSYMASPRTLQKAALWPLKASFRGTGILVTILKIL